MFGGLKVERSSLSTKERVWQKAAELLPQQYHLSGGRCCDDYVIEERAVPAAGA